MPGTPPSSVSGSPTAGGISRKQLNGLSKSSAPVVAAQSLFFLNAAIWLVFGIVTLLGMATRHPEQAVAYGIIAFLMFGNVGAMILSGLAIGKRHRLFYFFALAVLGINIVLTVTDQFGVFDLITLLIDVCLLGLLIAIRKRYF